ncbi:spore germination protein GerLC [Paenibacillus vulneris]|uniref:Ger(X)C family spore germination protein n=1 Tax=Paenibacillus vulneris TaxID=1133364 RepID=A0ABW3UU93_9BACL
MVDKVAGMLAAILILLFTTGCWDRVEIDERGFVIGIAIDTMKDSNGKEGKAAKGQKGEFMVTYQLVVPSGIKQSGSTDSGGGANRAYFNITLDGDTLTSLAAKLASKTSRAPFFEHLQVVLISDEVARKEGAFADTIDYFLRDSEMRRSLKIMVVKGEAKQVLEVKPPNEKLPARFISSAAENTRKSSRMLEESRLGEVHEKLLKRESFLIQLVSVSKDRGDISIIGSALFDGRTNNLIDFIGGRDTAGINLLRGSVSGGVINAEIEGGLVGYEINWERRRLWVEVSDPERPVFHIDIRTKGIVDQSFKQMDMTKEEAIMKLEAALSQKIKSIADNAMNKLQKKYGRDVVDLELFLYRDHYEVWKSIQKDWEEGRKLFTKAKVEVTVESEVQRSGSILKSERRGRSVGDLH